MSRYSSTALLIAKQPIEHGHLSLVGQKRSPRDQTWPNCCGRRQPRLVLSSSSAIRPLLLHEQNQSQTLFSSGQVAGIAMGSRQPPGWFSQFPDPDRLFRVLLWTPKTLSDAAARPVGVQPHGGISARLNQGWYIRLSQ